MIENYQDCFGKTPGITEIIVVYKATQRYSITDLMEAFSLSEMSATKKNLIGIVITAIIFSIAQAFILTNGFFLC